MQTIDIYDEVKNLWFDIAGDPEPVALDMFRMVMAKLFCKGNNKRKEAIDGIHEVGKQ